MKIIKIMIMIQVFVALICTCSSSSNEVKKADIRNLNNRRKLKLKPKSNRQTNLCILTRESFLLGKNKFHTSSIHYSGKNPEKTIVGNTKTESSNNDSFDNQLEDLKERLSQAEKKVESQNNRNPKLDNMPSSSDNLMDNSISEWDAFPWLRAENIGFMIYPHHPLSLFDSVKILRVYLEKGLKIDPDQISDGLLTKILEPFKNNNKITVQEFVDYIENLHTEDKDFIQKLIPSDSTDKVGVESPLDKIGFNNMHELFSNFRNLDWRAIWDSVKLTEISPADIASNAVSYPLLLRGFVKYVHNRPYPKNISPDYLLQLRRDRRLQLVGFAFIGAPFIMASTRIAAIS
jgi:hypothetical protein